MLDKAHIERSIVGNHNGSLTELQEFRQHRFDVRRVKNHVVVDAGQVLNPERDRDFRVDEGGKLIDNRSVFHTDGTDLNDFVDNRGKSRRLDIKHNVASVDVLSFAVDNDIFQVVDEISLHAVDDLERSRNFFSSSLSHPGALPGIFSGKRRRSPRSHGLPPGRTAPRRGQ